MFQCRDLKSITEHSLSNLRLILMWYMYASANPTKHVQFIKLVFLFIQYRAIFTQVILYSNIFNIAIHNQSFGLPLEYFRTVEFPL